MHKLLQPQTALVAHDRWHVRRSVAGRLRTMGWIVLTARNAEEAMQLLNRHIVQMVAIQRGLRSPTGSLVREQARGHPHAIGAQFLDLSNSLLLQLPSPPTEDGCF